MTTITITTATSIVIINFVTTSTAIYNHTYFYYSQRNAILTLFVSDQTRYHEDSKRTIFSLHQTYSHIEQSLRKEHSSISTLPLYHGPECLAVGHLCPAITAPAAALSCPLHSPAIDSFKKRTIPFHQKKTRQKASINPHLPLTLLGATRNRIRAGLRPQGTKAAESSQRFSRSSLLLLLHETSVKRQRMLYRCSPLVNSCQNLLPNESGDSE